MKYEIAFLAFMMFSVMSVNANVANVSATANWQGVGKVFLPWNSGNVRYNYADASMLKLANGTYIMFYSNFTEAAGKYNSNVMNGVLDVATSRDGIHWAQIGIVGTNPNGGCAAFAGSALQLSNGTIRVYSACGTFQSKNGVSNFTNIKRFVNTGQSGSGPSMLQNPNIFLLTNGTYKMYAGSGATFNNTGNNGPTASQILSYTSKDGFNFTQDPGVRISKSNPFNGGSVVPINGGHALVYQLANGTWIMYYDDAPGSGGNMVTVGTAIAMSKNGVNWTTTGVGVMSSETYAVFRNSNGTQLQIFGYYAVPGFGSPKYASQYGNATVYGGGLYYASANSTSGSTASSSTSTITPTTMMQNTTMPTTAIASTTVQAATSITNTSQQGSQNTGSGSSSLILPAVVVIVIIAAVGVYMRMRMKK